MEELKLIYLLIGACIALLSREFGRHMQMNISYNLKLHEKYSRISQEIINSLANITSLHIMLSADQCSTNNIRQCRQDISDLYFRHYNHLPQEVLNAMNCLFMCLSSNGKYLYIIQNCKYVPETKLDKLKYFMGLDRCKYVEFKQCEKSSDFITEDFKKMILSSNALKKITRILEWPEKYIPVGMKLNLQARYVIYVIHKYYQKPYVKAWDTYLTKHDVFKQK
mgnify:CR=1 FL=1